jgi:hypothetical protein
VLGPVVETHGPLESVPILGSIVPFASTVHICWSVTQTDFRLD